MIHLLTVILWMTMYYFKKEIVNYLERYTGRDGINEERRQYALMLMNSINFCNNLVDLYKEIRKTINSVNSIRVKALGFFPIKLNDDDRFLSWLEGKLSYISQLHFKYKDACSFIKKLSDEPYLNLVKQLLEEKNFLDYSVSLSICVLVSQENNFLVLIRKLSALSTTSRITNLYPGDFEAMDYSDNLNAKQIQGLLRSLVQLDRDQRLNRNITDDDFNDLNGLLQNMLTCANEFKERQLEFQVDWEIASQSDSYTSLIDINF